jgi:hypothetical protein
MSNQIIDFATRKYRHRGDTLCIGDVVEWCDYDSQCYVSRITSFEFKHFEAVKKNVPSSKPVPFDSRGNFIFRMENGEVIAGDVIIRKILPAKPCHK